MANFYVEKLKEDGIVILKSAFSEELADKVLSDFDDWSSKKENNFEKWKRERVTNFHVYSENTKELAANPCVKDILDEFFESEMVVYSSLYFREGTSQHYHRDTPHFYTNPMDLYCGVWYALEDIHQESGPLKYYLKSHELVVPNGIDTYNRLFSNNINGFQTKTYDKQNFDCLLEYNRVLEEECKTLDLERRDEKLYIPEIKKGDIIIWHPKTVHGGSAVINPELTRQSMVTHNIPINKHVFNAQHFFRANQSREYILNKCPYEYLEYNNVKYVNFNSPPKVQKSYL